MSHFERIKNALSSSSLEMSDKQKISDLFADISDENLGDIADLFEKKPEWITIFNDNRKKKQEAVSKGDESMIQEILEQEKKYLNELMYGLD